MFPGVDMLAPKGDFCPDLTGVWETPKGDNVLARQHGPSHAWPQTTLAPRFPVHRLGALRHPPLQNAG